MTAPEAFWDIWIAYAIAGAVVPVFLAVIWAETFDDICIAFGLICFAFVMVSVLVCLFGAVT